MKDYGQVLKYLITEKKNLNFSSLWKIKYLGIRQFSFSKNVLWKSKICKNQNINKNKVLLSGQLKHLN